MCQQKLPKRLNVLLMNSNNEQGLTLIELLVILAIIGLIGTLAAVAVNSARERSRDYKRLNDVTQIQASLEDYFNENNEYPSGDGLPLGDSAQSVCLGSEGFQSSCSGDPIVFMAIVPSVYDKGLKDQVQCGSPTRTAYCYDQTTGDQSYTIAVEFERAIPERGIAQGANCFTPTGISAGTCQ